MIPSLTGVDGVADVTLFGERERTLRVEVDPKRLAAYGLTIAEVAAALRGAQFDAPVGAFQADQMEVLVRADATVVSPEAIEALILRDPVRLGDVAEVYFAPATSESLARGRRPPVDHPGDHPPGRGQHRANLRGRPRRVGAAATATP